ncbi:hypothetical protein [Serratia liquefaciens]|nr:hypothetical protein [Serratia liquefaciens]
MSCPQHYHTLWITTVTDKTTWRELCQTSLGGDQARENSEQTG